MERAYSKQELAASAQSVMAAAAYKTAISQIRERATTTFTGRSASDEEVQEARRMVWLLDNLAAELQSMVDDAALEARRAR